MHGKIAETRTEQISGVFLHACVTPSDMVMKPIRNQKLPVSICAFRVLHEDLDSKFLVETLCKLPRINVDGAVFIVFKHFTTVLKQW